MAKFPQAKYSEKASRLYQEAIKDPSRTPPTFTEMANGGGAKGEAFVHQPGARDASLATHRRIMRDNKRRGIKPVGAGVYVMRNGNLVLKDSAAGEKGE